MKVTEKLHKERTREPAPPPPEGGIGICEAGREFGIPHQTIARWVKKGLVPVVQQTPNWTYIKKSAVAELAARYHQSPGRGKRAHLKETAV